MDVELEGESTLEDDKAVVVGDEINTTGDIIEVDNNLVVNILDTTMDDIEVERDDITELENGVLSILIDNWVGVGVGDTTAPLLELDITGGPILKSKNMVVSE